MVDLEQSDFQRLTRILQNQPEFALARDRYRFISGMLTGVAGASVILGRIDFDGTALATSVEVVRLLSSFGQVTPGKEALGAFLEQLLMTTGGGDDADFMSGLLLHYHLNAPLQISTASLPPPSTVPDASRHSIFISYAHADHIMAEQVEQYLRAAGLDVFRDSSDIRAGANWDMTIEQALQSATEMVLLLSQTSMPYRKEVYREWFFFDQQRKPIFPLLVQQCTLHTRLISYNYIDARDDLGAALAKLLTDLMQ